MVGEGIVSQNSASFGNSWSEKLLRGGGNCCRLAAIVWAIWIHQNEWEEQLGAKMLCKKEWEEQLQAETRRGHVGNSQDFKVSYIN